MHFLLGLEHAKNTNPTCTNTHTKRGNKIYEVRQDVYVPGTEERSINDLHKIQEDYNWFSQELSPEINLFLKMGYILYLYGGEETLKSTTVWVQNHI